MKRLILAFGLLILAARTMAAAGDDCSTAISLSSNGCSAAAAYNNTGITGTISPSCFGAGTNNTMWFKFVASTPTVIAQINGGTLTTAQISVMQPATGTTCGSPFTELACSASNAITSAALVPGNTYYIVVDGINNAVGTFQVCLTSPSAPPNDDSCSPTSLPVTSYCSSVGAYSNYGATDDLVDPGCFGASTANNGVWFTVVPTGAGLDIDIVGGTLTNPQVAILEATSCDPSTWTIVACNSTAGTATISINYAVPGQTYYVLVDGLNNTTGNFQICANSYVPSGTVSNDDCSNSLLLCPNTTYSATSADATSNALNDPSVSPSSWACNGVLNQTVWYKWVAKTPPQNVSFTIDATCTDQSSTQNFAQFEVFQYAASYSMGDPVPGTSPCSGSSDYVSMGCQSVNSNTGQRTISIASASQVSGMTYYVVVDDWPSSDCDFTFTVTGNQETDAGANQTICMNVGNQTMTGFSPAGGTWSGTGITAAGVFNPLTAGIGIHTLYYTAGACTDYKTITVTAPNVVVPPSASVCAGDCVDLPSSAFQPTNVVTSPSFSNTTDFTINDYSTITSTISVSGLTSAVLASVCLDISHTFDDDLDMYLICPDGTRLELSTDNGNTNNNFTSTCFTPTASTPINSGSAPFTGNFIPEGGVLTSMNLCSMNGTWSLEVSDDGSGDTGTLLNWSISFTNTQVTNAAAASYSWSPTTYMTNSTTLSPTVCPTSTTAYTLTALDGNGCSASDVVTVSITAPFTISITSQPETCNNSCNGTVSASPSLTSGTPYSYVWSNASTSSSQTGLCDGTYTVTVTNADGCSAINTVTLTNNNVVSVTPTITSQISCFGSSNGALSSTVSGGVTPYSYLWSNTRTTSTNTGLSQGTYTITVTDNSGCTTSSIITLTQPTALNATVSNTNANCFGSATGTGSVAASGGTTGYTYLWSGGQTSTNITGLLGGTPYQTYIVSVTDSRGCLKVDSIKISQPAIITATTSSTSSSCGASNGSVTVSGVSGGTTAYSYLWNNGRTTTTVTGLPSSNYTVTITDSKGCTSIYTQAITDLSGPSVTVTNTNVSCNGFSDGTVSSSVSGGATPYTYAWTGGSTSSSVSGLAAGTFGVTVTDNSGCKAIGSAVVTQPTTLLVDIVSSVNPTAYGASDGSVSSTISGGTTNYTYSWSPIPATGLTTLNVSGLPAGTYCITATDSKGCTSSDCVTLIQPNDVSITPVAVSVTCFGGSNGSLSATSSGGLTPRTYEWFNSSNAPVGVGSPLTGLPTGVYYGVVTDANGTTATSVNVTISQPTLLTSSITSSTNIPCNGLCNGNASVSGSGGTPSYSYQWSNGQNSSLATGLCAGTYTVTLSDANLCTSTTSVTITQPAAIVLSTVTTPLSCYQTGDGSASVSVSGGTSPYTYQWNDPAFQTSSTATSLAAGNYSVTATDNSSCTSVASVSVSEPLEILLSTSSTQSTCGQSDGSASVSVTQADLPYTYNWSSGSTTATSTGLYAGAYSLTFTDGNGCELITTSDVSDAGAPSVSVLTVTDVSCFGGSDGFAQIAVSGGTPPYNYDWLNSSSVSIGQTTASAFGLMAGTYTGSMTDDDGCMASVSVVINQPTALAAIISSSDNVSCFNYSDGSATVIASGGTSPYTYQWNDGASQTTPNATNLQDGVYTVNVTDDMGCITSTNVTITEPLQITLSTSITDAFCNTASGEICVGITNGSSPYSYNWSDGQANTCALNLIPNTYTITVTDVNGCTSSTSTIVGNIPAGVAAISSFNNVSCAGGSDGSASVSMSGTGTAPYSYDWSDGVNNNNPAIGLSGGIYTVTVTDYNSCTATTQVTITSPASISVTLSPTNIGCFGGNDGAISTSVSGGTTPYSYLWSDALSQSSVSISTLTAGGYTVTITDNEGCSISANTTLTQPTELAISGSAVSSNCGQSDGSACVTVSGGSTPYTYLWNSGEATDCIIDKFANTYIATVTDDELCTVVLPIAINDITGPSAMITTFTDVTCFGLNDGTASVGISGGAGTSFTVDWLDDGGISIGQNTPSASNLYAGVYTAEITDNLGCQASAVVTIEEPELLQYNFSSVDPTCFNACDGAISVALTGGTSPYSLTWNDPSSQTGLNLSGLCAGNYIGSLVDANGCSDFIDVSLVNPAEVSASTSITNALCFGSCDGTATVTPSAGNSPFTYSWNDGDNQLTPTAGGLCAGVYSVTVSDSNSCTTTRSVSISEPSLLSSSIAQFGNVSCFGYNDGWAQVTPTGGTLPYGYLWSSGAVTQTASNLYTGTYTVTITDNNECTAVSSKIITQPSALVPVITSKTNVKCYSGNDGSATASASGGTAPYGYLWNASALFQTSQTALNLTAGTHSVVVTDANSCSASVSVVITQPGQIYVEVDLVNANCGQYNGQITATPKGGTPPFTHQWNDPYTQTSSTAVTICAGCYTDLIIDNNGCTLDTVICINDIEGPTITYLSHVDVTCFGECTGLVNFNVNGGTPAYQIFTWKDATGAVLPTYNGSSSAWALCGNQTFSLEVTDAAGCKATKTQYISQPTQLISFVTGKTNVSCFAGNDGTASVSVGGGTMDYTYQWSAPVSQTTPTATGMMAGSYNVVVTDANTCTTISSVTISQPNQLVASSVVVDATCNGDCDGTVSLSSSGGTQPVNYFWEPSQGPNAFISNLCAGDYSVTLTDAKSCTTTHSATVVEPEPLAASISSEPSTCSDNNGVATVSGISGGTPSYGYIWSNGKMTSTITGLVAGVTSCTVYDSHGCMLPLVVTVNDLASPTIDGLTFVKPLCYNSPTGSATVNVTAGGSTDFTYQWNDFIFQNTQTAINLIGNDYCVTVTDGNGCTAAECGTLIQPNEVKAVPTGSSTLCFGQSTIIWGALQGGTTPYPSPFINWTNGSLSGPGPHTVSPPSGIQDYAFTVTDANGCTANGSVTIVVGPPLVIYEAPATYICLGESFQIGASGQGGEGPDSYVFSWSHDLDTTFYQETSNHLVTPSDTTTYRVILADGCTNPDTAYITVVVNPIPPITFSNVIGMGCPGLEVPIDGSTSAKFPGSSFSWDIGDTTLTGIDLTHIDHTFNQAGVYDVALTVTSPEGCSNDTLIQAAIQVYSNPIASFTMNEETTDTVRITTVYNQLTANAQNSVDVDVYNWVYADTQTAEGISFTHEYEAVGVYEIELTVFNEFGCKDTLTKYVNVIEDFAIYVPNSFTPDGDGLNDEFIPKGVGISEDNYEMFIFDRWGEVIFNTNNKTEGWDGTAKVKGGKKLVQNDVYVWKIKAQSVLGEKVDLTGVVTLVR